MDNSNLWGDMISFHCSEMISYHFTVSFFFTALSHWYPHIIRNKVKYAPPQDTLERTTWKKSFECCCLYSYYYQLFIELSGRKGSVTYDLRADISLPPCLPGDRYLKLGSKSDLRVKISGSIVRFDALAPRPQVLLLCYFVGACAATLEVKFLPYSWGKYPHRVDF